MDKDLVNIFGLFSDDLTEKAIKTNDVEVVKSIISRGLFKYNKDLKIDNVEIYKLLIQNQLVKQEDITIDYNSSLAMIKYFCENHNYQLDIKMLKDIITNQQKEDSIEKLKYLIGKFPLAISPFSVTITLVGAIIGSESLIYKACCSDRLEIVRHLLTYYTSNEHLKRDLTDHPYIREIEMAKLIIEDFGYPYNEIRTSLTSNLVDRYLETKPQRREKLYIAVEVNDNTEDQLCLPDDIIGMKRNGRRYFGYELTDGQDTDNIEKYIDDLATIGKAKIRKL